jgi:tetratricopeptide (TPR) repeat protein
MNQNRFAAFFVLAALCLFMGVAVCAAQSAPGVSDRRAIGGPVPAQSPQPAAIRPNNNELAARGFNELYNGDYDPAIRDFSRLRGEYPDDPFTSNYLLAAELFKELYRIGALETETYSSESFLTSKARRPLDMAAQKRIFDLIARVQSLCNARLQKNLDDTDALYARGVARGFRSTYMGMAEKSWMAGIRSALGARRDHERVLALDPTYLDAKMTVGIHNYIVGSLNWAGRAAVALVGVTGNRQKGLEYLREVSRSQGTSSNDAAMALSLFLRREQRYAEALELVGRLSRQYPRNFLLAVEYAHLLNAAGRGREAIAQYREALEKGRERKYSAFQPEVAAWGLGVSLRGQHEFEQAAEAFDLVTTISGADPLLIDRAAVAAGEMYDTMDQREQAVACYRKAIDGGRDGDYVATARKHLHHPYQFKEEPAPRR